MFDDQSIKTGGQVPSNLPTGEEPDDIFAKTDSADDFSAPGEVAPNPPAARPPLPELAEEIAYNPAPAMPSAARPSAVSAGMLRSKAENQPAPPVSDVKKPITEPGIDFPAAGNSPFGDPNYSPQDQYQIAGPVASRWIILSIISAAVVVIVGGAGWWIYHSYIAGPGTEDNQSADLLETQGDQESAGQVGTINSLPPADNQGLEAGGSENIPREVIDNSILFGEPVDSDEDQLDNELELTAGTDPNNWDSDGDGLGDGEELLVWQTNPLNPDTDGDSFPDRTEVLAGYDPSGPGRLLNPPTTTPK